MKSYLNLYFQTDRSEITVSLDGDKFIMLLRVEDTELYRYAAERTCMGLLRAVKWSDGDTHFLDYMTVAPVFMFIDGEPFTTKEANMEYFYSDGFNEFWRECLETRRVLWETE